jgi:hypothetical protein
MLRRPFGPEAEGLQRHRSRPAPSVGERRSHASIQRRASSVNPSNVSFHCGARSERIDRAKATRGAPVRRTIRKRKGSDAFMAELEKSYGSIIDDLAIDDLHKRFLRDRWLNELLWFEDKADRNQRRHYTLRLVTIVGGVVVPSLVGLSLKTSLAATAVSWATFTVSLIVALAAALESFFGFGERWRTFRRNVELLKAHGWQYFQLVDRYSRHDDHRTAFPHFATQVEMVLRQDMETFVALAHTQHAAHTSGVEQTKPVSVVAR